MTTKKTNSPHAPRPTGKDAAKRVYEIRDADGVLWSDRPLTWDEAWKRKEEVAGQRKSTTPRIKEIETTGFSAASSKKAATPRPKQWTEEERKAKAEAAARAAASAASAAADIAAMTSAPAEFATPPVIANEVAEELNALDAETELEEMSDGELEALADLLGTQGAGDQDIDSLIDEASGDVVSER